MTGKLLSLRQFACFILYNQIFHFFVCNFRIVRFFEIIAKNCCKNLVVSICKNAKTMNDKSLPSEASAMYVVEINAGLCDKYGIDKGTVINF